MRPFVRRAFAAIVLATALPFAAIAQGKLTTPKQFFGHEIGEDYWLPNYTQFAKYWETLAKESDRMVLDTIGLTAEGRPQLMAIVSSPENIKNREKYRQIAERLSHAEGLTEAQAKALAKEGKSIIWIDGGLHATEVLGANQLIETSWQFMSQNDEETLRILNDVIIVFVQANPDGMELVANWYMRESDPKKRNMQIPRLYQKYIGHDNNRDFYASNQPETINMNKAMYMTWYPQIMYNHHQTGPAGTVMFAPPFRDPMNFNIHSQILTGLDQVGSAMHARFVAENKPGVTMRNGMLYSTWFNGGLRTTAYFHNIIGLLTETIGNPTPGRIPLVPDKLIRSADLPLPIQPQEWHFRQSIDYSVTANRAVLDFAQRFRESVLFRNWQMGSEEIAAGNTDSWTVWPKRLDAVKKAIADAAPARPAADAGGGRFAGFQGAAPVDPKFAQGLRTPELRDPRGYIISSAQSDFPTALKFVEKLQRNAIIVHRANAAFTVAGTSYPAGSIVVKTAQAYRPFVIDMFEPQDHPDDFKFPGAPPTPPYDNAGYTLALQMGVHFDRVLTAFDCPCDRIEPSRLVTAPAGVVAKGGSWKLSPVQNDAFSAVARLQKAGVDVYRAFDGNFYVANNGKSRPVAELAARELGVTFAEGKRPAGAQKLTTPRIALFDRYGGQMPSGHTRWLLEKFGIPSTDIFPQELDAGNLRAKYDVIIFPDGSIPAAGGRAGRGGGGGGGAPDTASLPAEYRKTTGSVTVDKTVPQLKAFMEAGGRVVTIGSSTSLAQHLGLPVESYLTEGGKALPQEKFYVPGSILKASFDTTAMVTKGMDATANVFYDNSPVFKLGPDAAAKGVKRIAWYDKAPLASGWAWGEKYLEGGTAIAQASVGSGTLYLFGPEILFRGQPHGTFR
ncbi:MAG: M14 family metallopeptidase, partial [Gemmatimonadetes bacterium]|nr:M14 family metallopeptidase [Gemmatimonadota bacterium]